MPIDTLQFDQTVAGSLKHTGNPSPSIRFLEGFPFPTTLRLKLATKWRLPGTLRGKKAPHIFCFKVY